MKTDEGAAAWEAIADGWAERMRTGTDFSRAYVLDKATLALLGDISGKRVLDAGCGEGRFSRMMAERGALVTGIDLSDRMISLARQEETKAPLGIEYGTTDMSNLSVFEDGSFDLVLAYLSIIDVARYEEAISEASRVLKADGRFVFSIVHPCFAPPGSDWEPREPGTVPIRDADRLYKRVDNYFPAAEVRFRMWPTAPAETVNYHRPLTDYARACREAGLLVRDIVEPTPEPEVAERIDFFRMFFRAPQFIMFECVKARE